MFTCLGFVVDPKPTTSKPELQNDEARKLRCAWDTGAELNMIAENAIEKVVPSLISDPKTKVFKPLRRIPMQAVGGTTIWISAIIKNLPFRIKHFIVRADVYVTSKLPGKDILLGRPFMKEYAVNIQEGDHPQISFKVPREDIVVQLAPTVMKSSPAFQAATPSTPIGVKISTAGGLYAPWFSNAKQCVQVTVQDIKKQYPASSPTA
jgi:hypothetical protein